MVLNLPCLPGIEAEVSVQDDPPRVWWSHKRRAGRDEGCGLHSAFRQGARDRPERTASMATTPARFPNSIFSNTAAREYSFTDEFWYEVYELYMKALAEDRCRSFDAFAIKRTIRLLLGDEQIDVLLRSHPDAREF